MISFKALLRTNRRIGLAFAHDRGLDLQVRSRTDSRFHWQRFISAAAIKSGRKTDNPAIPRATRWVLVIPAYQCTTKYAILPSTDPAEIEKMLDFELPNIVPYNTQPWAWDFLVIDKQKDGTSKMLIVLSPLSVIDRHIKTLSSLGIKADVITTSAMFHTLFLSKEKTLLDSNAVGCFCFNDDYMEFFVTEDGQVTFLRGARLKKKFCESTKPIEVEIQRSLSMVKDQEFTSCPDRFFAVSADGSAADFVRIVQRVAGISVKEVESSALCNEHSSIMDRLVDVGSDSYLSSAPEKAQINLLPRHLKEKRRRSNKRKQTAVHALKVCFVLLLAFLCLKTSIWRKNRLLERYEQRLSAISPIAEKLQFQQQQLAIIESQLQGNVSTLDIISELYRVLPKDITVHYLSIEQNKKAVTRAQAKLLSQAFDCIGPLEQSDYFENVRQSYANQRQIEDSILIDFEIVADLQEGRRRKDKK